MDIFKPTSSIGEYVAVAESIKHVEDELLGEQISWGESAINILGGAIIDTGVEKVSDVVSDCISSKTDKSYAYYKQKEKSRNPQIKRNQIRKIVRKKAMRSVRWGRRFSNGISFTLGAVRSALPY